MAPFLLELETINTLEFCVVTTVGLFIEFNNLTTNTKCYIKNAGKGGKRSNLLTVTIIRQNPPRPAGARTAFSKPSALSARLPSGEPALLLDAFSSP